MLPLDNFSATRSSGAAAINTDSITVQTAFDPISGLNAGGGGGGIMSTAGGNAAQNQDGTLQYECTSLELGARPCAF